MKLKDNEFISFLLVILILFPLLKHSWKVKGGGRRGLKTAEILLAESCRKQVSFESGFKQRKGRRISEAGWQRVPDRRCKKAEGTLSERFGVALWDFQELLTR